MSDFDREWIDELKPDRAAEKPEKARRGSKAAQTSEAAVETAPVPPRGRTRKKIVGTIPEKPRGKRALPGYKQVNASVPDSVKASVGAYLDLEDPKKLQKPYKLTVKPLDGEGPAPRNLSDLIEQLLAAWVEQKGGDLFGGKK